MPRYFFHVHDGVSLRDEEGTVLPDLDSARREAVRFAAGLLAEKPDEFWKGEDWSLEVEDVEGVVLFTLNFKATRGKRRSAT